jgi:MYND finger
LQQVQVHVSEPPVAAKSSLMCSRMSNSDGRHGDAWHGTRRFAIIAATLTTLGLTSYLAYRYYLLQSRTSARAATDAAGTKRPGGEEAHFCSQCGKAANFKCSRCRHAWYCHRDCQREHWKNHKQECASARARTATAARRQGVEQGLQKLTALVQAGSYRQALQDIDGIVDLVSDCSWPLATLHVWCAPDSLASCSCARARALLQCSMLRCNKVVPCVQGYLWNLLEIAEVQVYQGSNSVTAGQL